VICPVCKKDALIVEYRNIELDYCPACGGVWFDVGELELLMGTTGLGDHRRYLEEMAKSPEVAVAEKKRKCPICRRKMKKTFIDAANSIVVDVCHTGDGIWFDGGEVKSLVKSLVGKSPEKGASVDLLSFVGEMFKHGKD
jgi:Zn-finger nucleic acid-binding protein